MITPKQIYGYLRETLFHHRYYSSATVSLRTAINLTTMTWSLLVLWRENALGDTLFGPSMTRFIHEDVYGWALLALSGVLLWRLWRQYEPLSVMRVGYVIQAGCWIYILAYMLLRAAPNKPAFLSLACLGAGVAFAAAICGQRQRRKVNYVQHPGRRATDHAVAP